MTRFTRHDDLHAVPRLRRGWAHPKAGVSARSLIVALMVAIVIPGLAAQGPLDLERAKQEALAALADYMETWNTRQPELWATSLNFPHVRPSAGTFRLTRSPYEYVATVDFERTLSTGWHRSQWERFRVLHVAPTTVHVAGQYARYTQDGQKLFTAIVTYIVTDQDGHWGTQARFGAGRVGVTGAEHDAIVNSATTAVLAYFEAINQPDDVDGWVETMHFPQVSLFRGALTQWDTPEAFKGGREPGRLRTWYHTRVLDIEAVQVGQDAVNTAVRYRLENSSGEPLAAREAVFLVTRREGVWKVQARSELPATLD